MGKSIEFEMQGIHPDARPYVDPATALQIVKQGIGGFEQQIIPGATMLDYYATNAPAVPEEYKTLAQMEQVNDGTAALTEIELMVQWRFEYARLMVQERNTFFRTGRLSCEQEAVDDLPATLEELAAFRKSVKTNFPGNG